MRAGVEVPAHHRFSGGRNTMPKQTHKYKRLSSRNIGYYWLCGKRIYLPGLYNSPESLQAYHLAMAELNEAKADDVAVKKNEIITATRKVNQISILELVTAFLKWGETYYVKNGKPTGENSNIYYGTKILVETFGHLNVKKFTQQELKIVRDKLVESGVCRGVVNQRLGIIKRTFSWGVGEGLIDPELHLRLTYVKNLHKGRSIAKDHKKRKPANPADVDAILSYIPLLVADMVRIQRSIGCRPGEIWGMTWDQIDTSDDIWIYKPSHKTEHHEIDKWLPLNKTCQAVLEKYKDTPPDAIIFTPKRTVREQAELKAKKRKTRIQPSQVKRKQYKQVRKESLVGDMYNRHSYRNAIQRACKRAGVPYFFPYQLRHRSDDGVLTKDEVRILYGHTKQSMTDVYTHEHIETLKSIARKLEGK
jgi:integrase